MAAETIAEPMPAVPAEHVREPRRGHRAPGWFHGADPAETHLASMVEDGRRRRRHGRSGSDRDRGRHGAARHGRDGRAHRTPKRFLFCFPWIRSRRVRTQILRCFVSGMFLTLLLSVCKLSPRPRSPCPQKKDHATRLAHACSPQISPSP